MIGGNAQYGGAAILATTSAVYSGAGLVSVALAKENHGALHARLPEAMTIDFDDLSALREVAKSADVIVIGPGLGLETWFTDRSFEFTDRKTKVGHWWFSTDSFAKEQLSLPYPQNTIFTPHEMELERLSSLKIGQQLKKPFKILLIKKEQLSLQNPQKREFSVQIKRTLF